MNPADLLQLALEAMRAHRLRYALSATAVLIGVAAVVLLASIGEGTRNYVLAQFSQFGTSILAVNPGATEMWGTSAGTMGGISRPLTLDDARALRRVPGARVVVPAVFGSARHQGERNQLALCRVELHRWKNAFRVAPLEPFAKNPDRGHPKAHDGLLVVCHQRPSVLGACRCYRLLDRVPQRRGALSDAE